MKEHRAMQLALDLDEWWVTLIDGSVLHLWAVGYSRYGGQIVFSALMSGEPNFEVPLVSIPASIVVKIRGG
jgi:hypothetical protein